MRPPQNAGENGIAFPDHAEFLAASMRPPQNAGENDDLVVHLVHERLALQ